MSEQTLAGPALAEPTGQSTVRPTQLLQVTSNLLERAKNGDREAIATMFRQFIAEDETILRVEYLGARGVFKMGGNSFGCLTDRRIASIVVAAFGEASYQDGYLEYVNSSAFYQPSLLPLYVIVGLLILGAFGTFGLSLLLLPFAGPIYYRVKKSGLVFWIKEGVPVYMFANRNRLVRANALWRSVTRARDARIKMYNVVA